MSDYNGRTTRFAYDSAGRVSSVTDPDGLQTSYGYDADGNMTRKEYPDGRVVTLSYDAQGRALSSTEAGDVNRTTYVYNDVSSTTVVTDARSNQTTYRYLHSDGSRRITRITYPNGKTSSYTYDGNLRMLTATGPDGHGISYNYDAYDNITTFTNRLGLTTSAEYYSDDESRGGLFQHLVKSVLDPLGHRTSYTYDARGNLSTVTDAAGGVWTYTYGALGEVTSVTDPLGHSSQYTYDARKRLASMINPLGYTTTFSWNNDFDAMSGITDANSKSASIAYDSGGRTTGVTDALSHTTAFGYTNGVMTSLTDAKSHATGYTFDAYGRTTRVTNPLGKYVSYTYDNASNIASVSDANGNSFTFTYDSLNRVSGMTTPEGNYSYTYNDAGQVSAISGPGNNSASLTYNAGGQVTGVNEQYPWGQSHELTYNYDGNGNISVLWTPWGGYRYAYDGLDRLTSLQTVEGKYFYFSYDAAGRRTKLSYPNGTETTYAYDAANQLAQVMTRNVSANTALSMRNYGYDHVGNRVAMQDFNGTHSYTYDNGYRLTGASHPNDTSLTNHNETYAYDEVGSRTSDNELGSYSHNAGNQLVENSSYTYTYDNNGNLTRKTTKATSEQVNYTYNSQNQLTRVQMPNGIQVDFKYDLFGHRVEKVVSTTTVTTTRYVYSGEAIIGILDGNNNVVSRVIHGPGVDEPLMIRSGTNEAYLYADGLGSIIAVADANATLQETVEYQAYGKAIYKDAVSGSTATVSYTGNPYGYTGREPDAETSLYYYRARYYDAEAGRFIQPDPIEFEGGDTNLYAYVGNRPVNVIDPKGTTFEQPILAELAAKLYEKGYTPEQVFDILRPLYGGAAFGTAVVPGLLDATILELGFGLTGTFVTGAFIGGYLIGEIINQYLLGREPSLPFIPRFKRRALPMCTVPRG